VIELDHLPIVRGALRARDRGPIDACQQCRHRRRDTELVRGRTSADVRDGVFRRGAVSGGAAEHGERRTGAIVNIRDRRTRRDAEPGRLPASKWALDVSAKRSHTSCTDSVSA
jgi:hypothetical protein